MSQNTAVLIHGCHLQANLDGKPWEQIVWGFDEDGEPTLAGRATMGLKVARDYGAALVIFSTGASERDGLKEGAYTLQRAFELNGTSKALAELAGFPSQSALASWLDDYADLDLESQNTAQECGRNFRLCADQGIGRIVIVSSPWHIQRCHTEALKVVEQMRSDGETVPEIIAIASHGSTEGVVILEPPHRGDMPKTKWHELGRRFFRVPTEKLGEFEGWFDDLLKKYGA